MKNIFRILLSTLCIVIIFFSCQKGIFWDLESDGFLNKDANGNCLPITVGGTYAAGQLTDASNFLQVEVNVTTTGTYNISTDTIDGIYFAATGSFQNIGNTEVKLPCFGTPSFGDTTAFTVRYRSSTCDVPVIINSAPVDTATYTLQGSPGNCMDDTLYGGYAAGVVLDSSSFIRVSVNVTTAGSYKITTDTVNGFYFAANGRFATTGIQTVDLYAAGTPVNIETDVFSVNAGSSACSFSVDVLKAVSTSGDLHFPLTNNSNWAYDDLWTFGDSVLRSITGTAFVNGYNYTNMQELLRHNVTNQYQFRYSPSDSTYYEYTTVDKYTQSFQYNKPVYGELPFLKEYLTKGDNWESPEFTDTASFGQVLTLKYTYLCEDANATMNINGNVFANVYRIKVVGWLRSQGNQYGPTGDVYEMDYAKGIGLIYLKCAVNGFVTTEMQIRHWQVF